MRVSVPLSVDYDSVRLAAISRLRLIRAKRAKFAAQERQTPREFVSGEIHCEIHYFEGRRYRLDAVERAAPPSVRLPNNKRMRAQLRHGAHRDTREATPDKRYLRNLRDELPVLLDRWQPVVGERVAEVRIKKMKARWGSCKVEARLIWLNLESAKKSSAFVEYALAPELVHLIACRHNDRFCELMDAFTPGRRGRRDELNRARLAHSEWRY